MEHFQTDDKGEVRVGPYLELDSKQQPPALKQMKAVQALDLTTVVIKYQTHNNKHIT
jgi:hypothetical protein